jgi:GR25 family glycosyltransferase involved in LPS biosynthesis
METELQRCGISAERIEAVTPETLPIDVIRKLQTRGPVRACTESHRVIWRKLLASNAPAALILEDDARLSPALRGFLRWPELAGDWFDVIKAETREKSVWLARAKSRHSRGDVAVERLLSQHIGTTGYVIGREAARRLLDAPELETQGIDTFLFSRHGPVLYTLRVFQCRPGLCIAEEFTAQPDSDIARSDISAKRPRIKRKRLLQVARKAEELRNFYWSFGRQGLLFGARRTLVPMHTAQPVAGPAGSPDLVVTEVAAS